MKHSHQKRPKSEAKADDGIQTPQHREIELKKFNSLGETAISAQSPLLCDFLLQTQR